jgi:hypothetical protein
MRNGFPTLDDLGITRKLSHRAQRLAEIPAKDFDWYLRTAAAQEWEITTRLLLYYSERRQATAKNRQRIVGGASARQIEFNDHRSRVGMQIYSLFSTTPWLGK